MATDEGTTVKAGESKILCLRAGVGKGYVIRHAGEELRLRLVGRTGRLEMLFQAPESFRVVREEALQPESPPRPGRRLRVDRGHPGGRREP